MTVCLALLLTAWARPAEAQSTSTPCILGYTVGFFNGVWNTEADADDGLNAIQAAIEQATGSTPGAVNDTYNDEEVAYQLFYNHTGSAVGATSAQDIAEVFIQRANELDPTGYFSANNFYLVWESLTNTTNLTNLVTGAATGSAGTALANYFSTFFNSTVTSAVATLSAELSTPPTAADYTAQNAQLDTLAAAGRKFVLIAHSQGNLFLIQAYGHVMPEVGATRVKAVHIAPASTTIDGNYLLSANDVVINGLRLDGGAASVEPNNITIPISTGDLSGHTLVGTYLDETRNGYAASTMLFTGALSALVQGACPIQLTPLSSNPSPGGTVTFTASINNLPSGAVLGTGYAWSILGNAGGTFTGPNGNVTTIDTTTPNVTYNAPSTATGGQVDTITVIGYATLTNGSLVNAEQLGTVSATVTIGGSGLVNGDFSNGLTGWVPSSNAISISTSESYGCLASQTGNPFASFNNYGQDLSLTQTFTVPKTASTLTLSTWNNLDPVEVRISIIDSTGTETVLGDFEPPSVQALSDPNNYYSVVCTGAAPAMPSYNIKPYAGQTVTLRLRGIFIGGINGTFANFDNVSVQ